MSRTITCHCGTKVAVPDDLPERRINCTNCGGVIFLVGAASSEAGTVEAPEAYAVAAAEPAPAAKPAAPQAERETTKPSASNWLDRYQASPEARKKENAKALALISKLGTLNPQKD